MIWLISFWVAICSPADALPAVQTNAAACKNTIGDAACRGRGAPGNVKPLCIYWLQTVWGARCQHAAEITRFLESASSTSHILAAMVACISHLISNDYARDYTFSEVCTMPVAQRDWFKG